MGEALWAFKTFSMRILGFVCFAAVATFLSVLPQPCNGGWIQNADLRVRLRQQPRAWSNKVATKQYKTLPTKKDTYSSKVTTLQGYETRMAALETDVPAAIALMESNVRAAKDAMNSNVTDEIEAFEMDAKATIDSINATVTEVAEMVDSGTGTDFDTPLTEMESSIGVICDATKMAGAHTCTHHTVSCICN